MWNEQLLTLTQLFVETMENNLPDIYFQTNTWLCDLNFLTFAHQNLISSSLKWMFVSDFKTFPQADFKISHLIIRHILWGHHDPDIWLPKSEQHILESKWMSVPNLKGFLEGLPEISPYKATNLLWGHLDLWPPKSNQFIHEFHWILVPNLKKFPKDVLEISCSQEYDGQQENNYFNQIQW